MIWEGSTRKSEELLGEKVCIKKDVMLAIRCCEYGILFMTLCV